MIEKQVIVTAKSGIHARPASKIVKLANSFNSDIKLVYNGKALNAKSMMEMMTAAVPNGAEITLKIDGADETEAFAAFEKIVTEEE
ncbi:MAG: HPr family phosphocarrier protein [Halanaerobiales bacterium]|nr:HPr family phosphocarrier protein [Halanaerobiales bacterium]